MAHFGHKQNIPRTFQRWKGLCRHLRERMKRVNPKNAGFLGLDRLAKELWNGI